MENTRQTLPEKVKHFFNNLSDLLDTKLLFFGSIQRKDYFPGDSDIDVDIFTNNVNSTNMKLQHHLGLNKDHFKKFIWKLNDKKRTLVHGQKVIYRSLDNSFAAEFSIYNEKFKQGVLDEHLKKTILPFYATWMLIVLKFLFYKLKLVDKYTFMYVKKKIMSFMIGLPDDQFIVLDSNPKTIKKHHYDIVSD